MAEQFIFTMLRLNKFYGQKQVLKDINLCFYPGAKIGIVGENGSGKSTILRIMAGLDEQFQGKAEPARGVRVGFVEQEPSLDGSLTVRQTVELAFAPTLALLKEYDEVSASMEGDLDGDAMQKALDRMAELQDKIDAIDGWNLEHHINLASEALMLAEDDQLVSTLSGGERRRVALCKALLERPDLLLLDEPTNHLDAETIDWLEQQLRDYPGTVLIVTHDRYFLDNITKWILELEGGHGIPFEGNYTSWLEQKLARLAETEKKESSRRRALERELDWIRMSAADHNKASRTRIAEYEQLVAKELAAAKDDGNAIQIAPGPHLGEQVIEIKDVQKTMGDNMLMKDVTLTIPRGAVVGIIGPNGAGKTTLFRMISGDEKPDSGSVVVGSTVKLAFVDQNRENLSKDRTIVDEVGEGLSEITLGKTKVPVRTYLARFGFKGADQQQLAGDLSGGERNRLNLAKMLKVGANVLMLDEPTNDLDVNTLRLLEDAISGFSGCVLLISHDRFFLNRICTHVIVYEGEAKVRMVEGNYERYEELRAKELGADRFATRRSRYRRLLAR